MCKLLLLLLLQTFAICAQKPKIMVWLSTTCPICQKSTLELSKVYEYTQSQFDWQFVFPIDTKASVKKFKRKYKLNIPHILDTNFELTKKYKITITPEVLILDSVGYKVYQGAIDDSSPSLGIHRPASAHYLFDACSLLLNQKTPQPSYVKPIGCIIHPSYE
jgi:hypothetical protein